MALVGDDEMFSMAPAELRFREACQYYALLKAHHGPDAGPVGNRFLWVCYADAFLMAIVSLKDLTGHRSCLNAGDIFRLMVVMRNITAHHAVAGSPAATGMVSRDIYAGVGISGPGAKDYEDPVLAASKVSTSLAAYEVRLKTEIMGTDRKTGRVRTRWDAEKLNVAGALRWNADLASRPSPRILLSDVFLNTLNFVAGVCGFTVPLLS